MQTELTQQPDANMDNAQQHWKILRKLGNDLANKVRSFMVVGKDGEGVMVATNDGQGFWFGTLKFESGKERTTNEPIPLDVPELIDMAQGKHYMLFLNKRGEIYSMGQNNRGQLGLGIEVDEEILFSPQLILIPDTKFISVRCGIGHSLALTDDGIVWAWGFNDLGQVGVPPSTRFPHLPSPRQLPELEPYEIVAVECGGYHSFALTDQGEVFSWGGNLFGQLGDRSQSGEHEPTIIFTPSPVKSIAAGVYHSLLLTRTGKVYECGWNCESEPKSGEVGTTDDPNGSNLVRIGGLPSISQIASHHSTGLSIAMSSDDHRCFVWDQLKHRTSINIPRELPSFYSTVESPLSYYSIDRYTPHSVPIPETPPSVSTRISRMFDNRETSDVQFVVEQRTIHAHRNILSNSSDYFARMFSETWLPPVDSEDPIVKVTIPDHSYQLFHTFLCLIYTDSLEVNPDLLPELFDLSTQYLVPDLQKLCISRMRTTLSPTNCCLYYPLTERHSLPELSTFQQDLVQFISTRTSEVYLTAAFQSMNGELCKQLAISIASLPPNQFL